CSSIALASLTSEMPVPLEHRTQPDTAFFVHVEDTHCRSAHGSQADDNTVGQAEMLFPGVRTWVEEHNDCTCVGVNARKIGALMSVASVAGQGKVGRMVIATMLARNDVLNVEPRKGEVLLLEQTILAAMAGAVTDKVTNRCIHQCCGRLARMARAFACKIPMRSIAST